MNKNWLKVLTENDSPVFKTFIFLLGRNNGLVAMPLKKFKTLIGCYGEMNFNKKFNIFIYDNIQRYNSVFRSNLCVQTWLISFNKFKTAKMITAFDNPVVEDLSLNWPKEQKYILYQIHLTL